MEEFAGLPNNILLAMAEINALSHWKAAENNKGSLSYRELVRRGEAVEQLLREQSFPVDVLKETQASKAQPGADIGDEVRQILVDIFREAALLNLYAAVSGCNPGTYQMR